MASFSTLTFSTSGTTWTQVGNAASLNFDVDTEVVFTCGAADTVTIDVNALSLGTGAFLNFFAGPRVIAGSGAPEGAVTAAVGSIYLRSNGGASTSLYVKESGSGNTGWVAK